MLQLKQIELRRGTKLLFQNATLQAHAGQRMGVIGVNGSGKSSLFALILQQLEADTPALRDQQSKWPEAVEPAEK